MSQYNVGNYSTTESLEKLQEEKIRLEIKKLNGEIKFQEEKSILEIEKLNREIRIQKRPLRNPINWPPFAAVLAAFSAITWAWLSGWFSLQNDRQAVNNDRLEVKNVRLELQKENLRKDITYFALEKKKIRDSIDLIKSENTMLGLTINKLTDSLKSPTFKGTKQYKDLQKALIRSLQENFDYNRKIADMLIDQYNYQSDLEKKDSIHPTQHY